jgi:hypothetical protein
MRRGLIAAALIAWSSVASAGVDFGIKTEPVIDAIKQINNTVLEKVQCGPSVGAEGETCTYTGETVGDRISIWQFVSSEEGYLTAITLDYSILGNKRLPAFDDPSMKRAWDFINTIMSIASYKFIEKNGIGSAEPITSYVHASVLRKPLPKRPDGIEVSTRFRRSIFTITFERVDY